jgi:hypothetical protein
VLYVAPEALFVQKSSPFMLDFVKLNHKPRGYTFKEYLKLYSRPCPALKENLYKNNILIPLTLPFLSPI